MTNSLCTDTLDFRRIVLIYLCVPLWSLLAGAQQSGLFPSSTAPPQTTEDANLANHSPRFSIGLGVLSPSYSQKFGDDGKIKLDFNQGKGSYSYSLSNIIHPLMSAKATDKVADSASSSSVAAATKVSVIQL